MCGHAPKVPASRPESRSCPPSVQAAAGYTIPTAAAQRLIAHIKLARRMKAEVQNLYSRSDTERDALRAGAAIVNRSSGRN
jgi:hypothetical protein